MSLVIGLTLVMAGTPADAQAREKEDPYLSKEDIALIKVYEVDLESDPPPTIKIPRNELRNFLKEFQGDDRVPRGKQAQDRWVRSDGHKQLELLFKVRARDYYKHVRVTSRIESLRAFSNIHRRYILGYFQPTFGSGAIQSLYIFPQGRDSERIEMTNYYILTQATVDGKPIIDRNAPEQSLLVQWGLPREEAKFPAPDIDGWEPKFKDTKDERFIEHVEWIKSLVPANQGSNLGIDYRLPKHKKPNN
jgi:hypothetical protein